MPSPQVRKGLGQPWLLDLSFRGDGSFFPSPRNDVHVLRPCRKRRNSGRALFHSPLNARSTGGRLWICGAAFRHTPKRSVGSAPAPTKGPQHARTVGWHSNGALTRSNNGPNGPVPAPGTTGATNGGTPVGPLAPRAWQTVGRSRANSLKQSRQAAAPRQQGWRWHPCPSLVGMIRVAS